MTTFHREAQVQCKLSEVEGVVQWHASGIAKKVINDQTGKTIRCPYIMMDFAEKGDLFDLCLK